jgi:hypothetical protein
VRKLVRAYRSHDDVAVRYIEEATEPGGPGDP